MVKKITINYRDGDSVSLRTSTNRASVQEIAKSPDVKGVVIDYPDGTTVIVNSPDDSREYFQIRRSEEEEWTAPWMCFESGENAMRVMGILMFSPDVWEIRVLFPGGEHHIFPGGKKGRE